MTMFGVIVLEKMSGLTLKMLMRGSSWTDSCWTDILRLEADVDVMFFEAGGGRWRLRCV